MAEFEIKQVLYRAVADKDYGKYTLVKVPATDDVYGDYKLLAEAVNNHYKMYDTPMTQNALELATCQTLSNRNKLTAETKQTVAELVASIFKLHDKGQANYSNDDSIRDSIDKWSRKAIAINALKSMLARGADLGSEKTLESLQSVIKESLQVGSAVSKFETVDLFNDDAEKLTDKLSSIVDDSVPVGWKDLDAVMGGGLVKGDMGLVVAKSGFGKTQTLVNLAKMYITHSKQNVLYVALEERTSRMLQRFIQVVAQIGRNKLVTPDNKHLKVKGIESLLKAMHKAHAEGRVGGLELYKSRPHTVSITDLDQAIQSYGLKHGYYPDVLMIDYPDLMKNKNLQSNVSEYRADGMLYEQLRALAEQYNMILWVASQTNRTANESDIVTVYNIEGSKQKLNTVDLCISLNRTPKEFQNGFIRFYLDKVRYPDKIPSDNMIYMKVDKKYIGYLDETEADKANHKEILADANDDHFGKYRKASTKKNSEEAAKKIEEANRQLLKQSL